MKGGRGDLKLDHGERRMLAPVQAYCSYYWSTIQPIVATRWQAEKASETFDDDDDPPDDDADTQQTGGWIPLSFKLKIARELYEELPKEVKRDIDLRREGDKEKWHRKIPDIEDDKERAEKLQYHQRCRRFG